VSLLFAPGQVVGGCRIDAVLGRGGMGVVYRAWQVNVGRPVALKVLPPLSGERALWRLRREARLLSRLAHPGIVRVFDAGLHGSTPFCVMELVEGETLGAWLARRRQRAGATATAMQPAPADRLACGDTEALLLLASVAEALSCAHAAGIVHRDVKPGNVLVSQDGRVLLGDFGLAFDAATTDLTATGELVGTPYYMSPEQVRGERVDHRTDVYSLGVVLYEALSGSRPFEAPTTAAVLSRIDRQTPDALHRLRPDLPRDLHAIVGRAMAPVPADRYETAGALAADLRAAARGEPVSARPPGLGRRSRAWVRRDPWRVAALLIGAAALVGLLGLWQRSDREVREEGERAEAALAEVGRLALSVHLDHAEQAADAFVAARPEQVEAMRAWLAGEAQDLADQVEPLRVFVAALRGRARPYGELEAAADRDGHPRAKELAELERAIAEWQRQAAGGAATRAELSQARVSAAISTRERDELAAEIGKRRTWRFDRVQDQLLHEQAAALLQRLEHFALDTDGTMARVRAYLDWAEYSRQRGSVDGAAAWREAIAAIAADPRYRGLELPPQTDLLPLGRDRRSGLYEFVHLRSGVRDQECPARDDQGELMPDDTMGIVLVLVPGGEAVVGAQCTDEGLGNHDPSARPEEGPVHRVRLAPFLLSKYEVTRAQWACMTGGEWPSKRYGHEHLRGKDRPVDSVPQARARAVLAEQGLTLPTEVQWEYACRAGTSGPFSFADRAAAPACANFADRQVARANAPWPNEGDLDDGHFASAPVGSFAPNAFGLHDMHGNVAEWCDDPFAPYVRPVQGAEGRRRLTTADGTSFVSRGGGYDRVLDACRSAHRLRDSGASNPYVGLRAARRLEAKP